MTKKKSVPQGTIEAQQLKVIGRAFRDRRLDLKLQFKDVADTSGISSLTISKLEKGELENCSLGTLNSIAHALGMRITHNVTIIEP